MLTINDLFCKHYLNSSLLQDERFINYVDTLKYPWYKSGVHIVINIKDSLQYSALVNNDFSIYEKYITETNQHEHSVEIFQTLKRDFSMDKFKKIQVYMDKRIKKLCISDGVHRLSILLFKGLISEKTDLTNLIEFN